jgi:hypothetical protein
MAVAEEVIDHLEALLALGIIDPANIQQELEMTIRVVPEEA